MSPTTGPPASAPGGWVIEPLRAVFYAAGSVKGFAKALLQRRVTVCSSWTDPEPAPAGSAFYELPNVQLSSHLAGAHGDEVVRMADTMIEEFRRWQEGEPLLYSVSLDMLDRMA